MSELSCGFVGLGLIGGSIAKAIRKYLPDTRIVAYDINSESLDLAVSEGIVTTAVHGIDETIGHCDYVFLCAPVSHNSNNLLTLKNCLGPDTLLTDVGSVKTDIHEHIKAAELEHCFIGGHPMAGSERFGYSNSSPQLLERAYYILTPTETVPQTKVTSLQTLVQTIGAIPLILTCQEHDYVTGAVSHLPHVISAALVNLVHDSDSKEGLMKMIAAGGFKDITRISSSSPTMWQQICLTNTENIAELLEDYIKSLSKILEEIKSQDQSYLYDFFDRARSYRESFINTSSGPIKTEYVFTVDIPDRPGSIAAIASLLSMHEVSIKNIGINHNREFAEGALRIEFYDEKALTAANEVLQGHGFSTYTKKA